jgi:hypothetical protein
VKGRSGYTLTVPAKEKAKRVRRGPRFVFHGPCFQPNSNGIRIYYLVAEELHRLGHEVVIVAHDHHLADHTHLPARLKPLFRLQGVNFGLGDLRPDDIVVYPDVTSGNPLGGSRLVRYLANRPLVLTGHPVDYGPSDFIVSYSAYIDTHAYPLFVLNDDRKHFYPSTQPKASLALVYFGKVPEGPLPAPVEAFLRGFEQRLLVTRTYPRTRSELGDLLRRAQVLVTMDPLTNLSYEATLCSTPALIVKDDFGLTRLPVALPTWGYFTDPAQFGPAQVDARRAFPLYVEALRANRGRIADFAEACINHFQLLEAPGPEAAALRELNRRYVSLRAEYDQLRFESAHGRATLTGVERQLTAPAAPPPPPRHLLADNLNGWAKRLGPVHWLGKRAVSTLTGLDPSPQAPPLRHQLVDSLNARVKKTTWVHAALKRSLAR